MEGLFLFTNAQKASAPEPAAAGCRAAGATESEACCTAGPAGAGADEGAHFMEDGGNLKQQRVVGGKLMEVGQLLEKPIA